jgi:hypothetical protein
LFISFPGIDSFAVVSMKCSSCGAGRPNRTGVPNRIASAQSRSARLASGMSPVAVRCAAQASRSITGGSATSSGILRNRTSAPTPSAADAAAAASLCTFPLDE